MDVGALTSGLVTGLREGVEAALIIAIICAYLAKTGNRNQFPQVFLGAGTAIGLSVDPRRPPVRDGRRLRGAVRAAVRGGDAVAAAGVVTWMLFWMRRQARAVSRASSRRRSTGRSTRGRSARWRCSPSWRSSAKGSRPRSSSSARRTRPSQDAIWVSIGALIGLAIAAVLGVGFYQGSRRINLATFFRWTGVALDLHRRRACCRAPCTSSSRSASSRSGRSRRSTFRGVLPHEADGGNLLGQFLARDLRLLGDTRGHDVRRLADVRRRRPGYLFLRPMKPVAQVQATGSATT